MTDETVSIDVSQGGKDAYDRSCRYTVGTYGVRFAASAFIATLTATTAAGTIVSVGTAGPLLATAAITASATAASTATSLVMRGGYEKQIAKDVFTYKALGFKDWYDGHVSQDPQNYILEELKTLVNARAANQKNDDGVYKELNEIIESGKWTAGDKDFICQEIDSFKSNNDKEKLESLSELYAKLKLNLYDRNGCSVVSELAISTATSAAVGAVGGGFAAAISPHVSPFIADLGTSTVKGATSYAIRGAVQGKLSLTNLLITEIVTDLPALGAETTDVVAEAISPYFNTLTAIAKAEAEYDIAKAEYAIGAVDNGVEKFSGLAGDIKEGLIGKSSDQSQSTDQQPGADPRILTDTLTEKHSFQDAHSYWRRLENNHKDFTDGFFKWMNEEYKHFKLYRPNDLTTLTSNNFGCPKSISADSGSNYGDELYERLKEYCGTLEKTNEHSADLGQNGSLNGWKEAFGQAIGKPVAVVGKPVPVGEVVLGVAGVAVAGVAGVLKCAPSASPGLSPKLKKGLVMTDGKNTVRYYAIGSEFTTLSGGVDKSKVADGIEDDFKKVEENSGVILSSKVKKKADNTDNKTISIIINNSKDKREIIFHDKRIETLNKEEKFYFKLHYEKDKAILTIINKDGWEIKADSIKNKDAKEIFDSIDFNIFYKGIEVKSKFNLNEKSKIVDFSKSESESEIEDKKEAIVGFARNSKEIDTINQESTRMKSSGAVR